MKVLVLIALATISTMAMAEGYQPGEINYVNGRNGSASYTNVGSSSYGSDGSSYSSYGSSSNGTHVGDAAFDQSATRIGDSVYRTDGSSCTKIGSTAYCN